MAKILKTTGEIVRLDPPEGKKALTLEQLQEAVGGSIEIVTTPEGRYLVVNEEGKLIGLSYNHLATIEYANPRDVIAGDAVLCERWEIE